MTLNYLLVSEGASDRMLQRPIEWLLDKHCSTSYTGGWANPSALERKERELDIRLEQVHKFFPCDIAFVHRDTDTFTVADRTKEIVDAVQDSRYPTPLVCVIPVKMTEAWFLFDEFAIRKAAGKPNSRVQLDLPGCDAVQRRADPKKILDDVLITASELAGRRLKQFKAALGEKKSLVSNYINDYSPLRGHESFCSFEKELIMRLDELGLRKVE